MAERKLTLKQERWKAAYLQHGNATQAVIDAGYKCRDRTVAKAIGTENLAKPYIAGAIQLARTEISEKTGITVESEQRSLWSDIQAAREAGNWGAVMSGHTTLLRSIGGMTGDRPHPDAIASKALDAGKARDLRAIAEAYYAQRYLADTGAKEAAKQVQSVEAGGEDNSQAVVDSVVVPGQNAHYQANNEDSGGKGHGLLSRCPGAEGDFQGEDPLTPQAAGGQHEYPPPLQHGAF